MVSIALVWIINYGLFTIQRRAFKWKVRCPLSFVILTMGLPLHTEFYGGYSTENDANTAVSTRVTHHPGNGWTGSGDWFSNIAYVRCVWRKPVRSMSSSVLCSQMHGWRNEPVPRRLMFLFIITISVINTMDFRKRGVLQCMYSWLYQNEYYRVSAIRTKFFSNEKRGEQHGTVETSHHAIQRLTSPRIEKFYSQYPKVVVVGSTVERIRPPSWIHSNDQKSSLIWRHFRRRVSSERN